MPQNLLNQKSPFQGRTLERKKLYLKRSNNSIGNKFTEWNYMLIDLELQHHFSPPMLLHSSITAIIQPKRRDYSSGNCRFTIIKGTPRRHANLLCCCVWSLIIHVLHKRIIRLATVKVQCIAEYILYRLSGWPKNGPSRRYDMQRTRLAQLPTWLSSESEWRGCTWISSRRPSFNRFNSRWLRWTRMICRYTLTNW